MNKRNARNLILFIVISLASGWIGVLVDSLLTEQPEGNSLGMGIWLILPLLTGIVLRVIARDGKNLGIKPHFGGNIGFYALALLLYPLATVVTVGFAKMLGSADLSSLNLNAFLSLAAVGVVSGLVKNIFEEFAWRGYLTPKLIELKLHDTLVYGISGLVWALWHAPYYLVFLPDIYFQSISRVGMLLVGCVLMTCWSVMYTELYRITKSVWPCVLMHAIEDAFPTVLVATGAFITFTKSGDLWWNPTTGIITTVLFLAVGLLLRQVRIKRELLVRP